MKKQMDNSKNPNGAKEQDQPRAMAMSDGPLPLRPRNRLDAGIEELDARLGQLDNDHSFAVQRRDYDMAKKFRSKLEDIRYAKDLLTSIRSVQESPRQ